nr:immunoglobulin light chain junction region [Mus musculus]NSM00912.1 immunoglobulin light chain junction region [Mus musculus]
CQQYSTYHTF